MQTRNFKLNLVSILFIFVSLLNCTSSKLSQSNSMQLPPEEEIKDTPKNNPSDAEENLPMLKLGESEFFKIVLGSFATFSKADSLKNYISGSTDKIVFLVKSNNRWNVQIGDYFAENKASVDKKKFQSLGLLDARMIHYRAYIPSAKTHKQPEEQIFETTIPAKIPGAKIVYTIQVIATKNKKEAENLQKNLKMLKIDNSFLNNEDGLWKVQVGKYKSSQEARSDLRRIREMGFNDSWITKRKSS